MSTATTPHLDSITDSTLVWVEDNEIVFHSARGCVDAHGLLTERRWDEGLGKFPCGTCIDVDIVPTGPLATRRADSVDRPDGNGQGTGAGPKGGPASPKQLAFIDSLRAQVGDETYTQVLAVVCPDGRKVGKADASDLIDRLIKARDAAIPKGTPTWSPKQDAFLRSLFEDRQVVKVGGPLDGKTFDEAIAVLAEGDFISTDSRGASALIDAWKAAPRREAPKATDSKGGLDEDADGFFVTPDGKVVKVQFNRAKSNRYAKVLDTDTGSFEYAGKAPLRWELEPLTAERAAELGRLYGRCVACGATLTDEDSIQRGMGPVCATKF
jgi:hypothetical protein